MSRHMRHKHSQHYEYRAEQKRSYSAVKQPAKNKHEQETESSDDDANNVTNCTHNAEPA